MREKKEKINEERNLCRNILIIESPDCQKEDRDETKEKIRMSRIKYTSIDTLTLRNRFA